MSRLWTVVAFLLIGLIGAGLWWTGEKGPMTGRVVDADGKPLKRVSVVLEKQYGEEMIPRTMRWNPLSHTKVHTEADGRFSLQDPNEKGRFRLVVDDGVSKVARVEVERGETNLEVSLEPAWMLLGELTWDNAGRSDAFYVVLMAEGESEFNFDQPHARVDASRNLFEIEQVPAGKYQLVVLHNYGSHPLLSRELQLEPGGGRHELGHMDLRGKLNKATLTLVSRGDFDGARVTAVDLDGRQMGWEHGDEVTVYFTEESIDLGLLIQEYRNVVLESVRGDREVAITQGIPIEITFSIVSNFPEDVWTDIELEPIFDSEGPNSKPDYRRRQVVRNYSGSTNFMPDPGDYRIMVRLTDMRNVSEEVSGPLPPMTYVTSVADAPIIHVKESEELQTFHIEWSQKTVWEAITRLQNLDWPE